MNESLTLALQIQVRKPHHEVFSHYRNPKRNWRFNYLSHNVRRDNLLVQEERHSLQYGYAGFTVAYVFFTRQ